MHPPPTPARCASVGVRQKSGIYTEKKHWSGWTKGDHARRKHMGPLRHAQGGSAVRGKACHKWQIWFLYMQCIMYHPSTYTGSCPGVYHSHVLESMVRRRIWSGRGCPRQTSWALGHDLLIIAVSKLEMSCGVPKLPFFICHICDDVSYDI
jgi:hypothetical protein